MLREQARDGMKVLFGRGNGTKTLGKILKCNPSKAKIETLEERGNGRGSHVGAIWTVPYSLMEPDTQEIVNPGKVITVPPVKRPKLTFNPFQSGVEQHILQAIACVYNELSPENLSCDGECSISQIRAKQATLNRQLRGLQQAFGREVDEMEVFDWQREREAHERQRQQQVANSR